MNQTMDGFQAALGLLEPLDHLLKLAALASLRIMAAFILLPPMGDKFVHGMLRLGIVAMIAIFVAFGAPYEAMDHFGALDFVAHGAKEAMIGLLLGFAGAKVFWIAQCVGALIDTQSGYNNVQLTNPLSGEQSTPVADFLLHLVSVLFFSMGGMLVFLSALFASFHVWPLGSLLPEVVRVPDLFVIEQIQSLMVGVVKFAAPVLLVLMLIDLGFGLITRAAGKLELSNLSQPVKGAVTILLLALLVGTLIPQMKGLLLPNGLLEAIESTVRAGR